MHYKISGKIIEGIFDDKGNVISILPDSKDFKVEEIKEEDSPELLGECESENGGGECTSDDDCIEILPPWWPFHRRCQKDSSGVCRCFYQND